MIKVLQYAKGVNFWPHNTKKNFSKQSKILFTYENEREVEARNEADVKAKERGVEERKPKRKQVNENRKYLISVT